MRVTFLHQIKHHVLSKTCFFVVNHCNSYLDLNNVPTFVLFIPNPQHAIKMNQFLAFLFENTDRILSS